jgi:hypothetical protein
VGKALGFVTLMFNVLGQSLLRCGELERELGEPSEFDLIFRKGLGHVVEHPVDFQVVVGSGIVLFGFLHEGRKGWFWASCSGEILVGDGGVRVTTRESRREPSRACRRGGGGRVGGVGQNRSGAQK